MKILITTQIVDKNSPLLGFFHAWLLEFADYFKEVHVICLQEGEHSLPENVFVYSLGKETGESRLKYTLRFYRYFLKVFFTVKVDYVFFHMGAIYNIMSAPFFWLRKLFGTKFYWWKTHGHMSLLNRLARFFVDRIYTAVAESFPINTPKRRAVGHAIDTKLFQLAEVEKEPDTLLFVGRFARSKRLEQVIAMVKLLKEQGVSVKATFIGAIVDSDYYQELQFQAQEDHLLEEINFIEGLPQSELITKYQTSRVFVNPSDNDGLDKVILEAILCGTIPLTANLSFESLLKEHDLYLEKGDIAGYVALIKEIFRMDKTKYNEKVNDLRETVLEEHALHTLMDRLFTD